jgi:hypothetical protein
LDPAVIPADYGFEYSDEEPEEEDVDIENQYYNSKGGRSESAAAWAAPAPAPAPCTTQHQESPMLYLLFLDPLAAGYSLTCINCKAVGEHGLRRSAHDKLKDLHLAAGMLEGDDPREALDGFRQVVAMEQDKGEW